MANFGISVITRVRIPELIPIEKSAFGSPGGWSIPDFEMTFDNQRGRGWFIFTSTVESPIGYLLFSPTNRNRFFVHSIAIVPDFQRFGAGSFALSQLKTLADERGFDRTEVEVNGNDPDALAFFQANHFRIVRSKFRYYDDGSALHHLQYEKRQPIERRQRIKWNLKRNPTDDKSN